MTDQEFIDAFTAERLAPEGFDHRAHLRAAFLLLRSRPFLEACIAMREGLLDGWYSKALLASSAARKTFAMPDLMGARHG